MTHLQQLKEVIAETKTAEEYVEVCEKYEKQAFRKYIHEKYKKNGKILEFRDWLNAEVDEDDKS